MNELIRVNKQFLVEMVNLSGYNQAWSTLVDREDKGEVVIEEEARSILSDLILVQETLSRLKTAGIPI